MIINRTESKYIVPAGVSGSLLSDLIKFAKYDQFCIPNLEYKVYSTYFDTYDYSYYKKRLENEKSGYRIRIRAYESGDNASLKLNTKFEIKAKREVDYKESFLISPQLFYVLSKNKLNNKFQSEVNFKDLEVIEKINSLGVHAVCNIEYVRKAFYTDESKRIRITLDTSIFCSDLIRTQKFNLIDPLTSIIEIKNSSQDQYPYWLAAILNKYSLKHTSFGKYKKSLQLLSSSLF